MKTGAMAGVGAGITVLNFPVFGKNAPSNKLVIGVMGVNSRGNWLARVASKLPNAEVGERFGGLQRQHAADVVAGGSEHAKVLYEYRHVEMRTPFLEVGAFRVCKRLGQVWIMHFLIVAHTRNYLVQVYFFIESGESV